MLNIATTTRARLHQRPSRRLAASPCGVGSAPAGASSSRSDGARATSAIVPTTPASAISGVKRAPTSRTCASRKMAPEAYASLSSVGTKRSSSSARPLT